MEKQKEIDVSTSALKIYIFLLKKNPQPVPYSLIKEEVALPKSTIHYNLDRLQKEGLIEETPNGYKVKEFEQLQALKHYISVFGKVLPTYVLFVAFFFVSIVASALLISELIPQVKFVSFILSLIGFFWSIRLFYKYRL